MIELRLLGALDLTGGPDDEGLAAGPVLRQPKRVGLLAYLAVAGREGHVRRDQLLALFWPEHTEERARHALRQSLHVLRRSLGAEAIASRGDDELAVRGAVLWCDAVAFEAALDDGRLAEALALYRGDLLPGLFVSEAPEFERWLDDARTRLRQRAAAAARALAEDAERATRLTEAGRWARRAHELAPDDEAALRRLLQVLDRTGDRAGALRTYEVFATRLARDLEVEPAPETQALVRRLRDRVQHNGYRDSGDRSVLDGSEALEPADPQRAASTEAPAATRRHEVRPASAPAAGLASRRALIWGRAIVSLLAIVLAAGLWAGLARGAASLGRMGAAGPRTSPALARRFYEEAMHAMRTGDASAAARLFGAAQREDPQFALAATMHAHALEALGRPHEEVWRTRSRAYGLASRQSDHDRLLVLADYTRMADDPRRRAYAESLVVRYPEDLQGLLLVGRARKNEGDRLGAAAAFRRLITLEASTPTAAAASCLSCEAYDELVGAYENADSLAAAERTAREWARRFPRSAAAWAALSYQLGIQERFTEALAARQRADDLSPHPDYSARMELLMRATDFATADRIAEFVLANGTADEHEDVQWTRWLSLHEQGRWREALSLAEAMSAGRVVDDAWFRPLAQSRFETGRPGDAAAVWEWLEHFSPAVPGVLPSQIAHRRAWNLTQVATALVAAGDTARAAALVDSVRRDGERIGGGRERVLHHHVRGLLLLARGRAGDAGDELARAEYGTSAGYSHTYLARGRACLAAGRPADAVAPLRGVVRGPIGAGGMYGTRAEARELLGRAWEALGRPDSALAHYRWAIAAWRRADPGLVARRRAMEARVAALGGER